MASRTSIIATTLPIQRVGISPAGWAPPTIPAAGTSGRPGSTTCSRQTPVRRPPMVIPNRTGLALAAILAAASLCPAPARADVKLPSLFTSHMVLQRDQSDRVWGRADPSEVVTVTIAGQTKTARAGADGKWSVTLDPLPAGGPHTLTVVGKNMITVGDVLVGEVWLCSGQSNMQWQVSQANDGDLEARSARFPQIRLISVPQVGTQEPQ